MRLRTETSSPGWTRTNDLVINSHPLYQLSYRGSNEWSDHTEK